MVTADWAYGDLPDPRKCHWFSEKLSRLEAPYFFAAEKPYRSIASLELMATGGTAAFFSGERDVMHFCLLGTVGAILFLA